MAAGQTSCVKISISAECFVIIENHNFLLMLLSLHGRDLLPPLMLSVAMVMGYNHTCSMAQLMFIDLHCYGSGQTTYPLQFH